MSEDLLKRLDDDWRQRALRSPYREFLTDYPLEEIRGIEAEMTDAASHFSKPQLDALGAIIGFTVEFFYYLKRTDMESLDADGVKWVNLSTVSGMRFFVTLCQTYGVTEGSVGSRLPRGVPSLTALKDEFTTRYQAFCKDTTFETKCGLLLDLFKLQIVFMGLTYDWE